LKTKKSDITYEIIDVVDVDYNVTRMFFKTNKNIKIGNESTNEFVASHSRRFGLNEVLIFPIIDGKISFIDEYSESETSDIEGVIERFIEMIKYR
jgi:hypothetical protein